MSDILDPVKRSTIGRLARHASEPLHKNSVFLIITNAAIVLIGFVFWAVAARLFEDDEIGYATALVSATLLLQTFSRLGIEIALVRYLPEDEKKVAMINTSLTVGALFSIGMAFVFVMGLGWWSPKLLFVQENPLYALAFILITCAATVVMLQQSVFVAYRKAELSLIVQGSAGLRLAALALVTSLGGFAVFCAWGTGAVVGLLMGIVLTARLVSGYRPVPKIDRRIVGDMLGYSVGNYVAESAKELPGYLIPLLIVNLLEPSLSAYFYITWTISGALFMVSYATNYSLLAESSYQPEELRRNIVRAGKFLVIVLVPAVVVVALLGGWILSLFGSEYAGQATWLLRILAVSSIPLAVNNLYVTAQRIERKVAQIIIVYALIALITIAVSYFVMRDMGLTGIGMAWLLGQGVVAVGTGLTMAKRWYEETRGVGSRPESLQ